MQEIKLTDNQLQKLNANVQQVASHRTKIKELEAVQNDLISLICEFHKVKDAEGAKFTLDMKNGKLTPTK